MPFIGIIAEEKSENYIRRQIVEKLKLRESSVLFIKEKSIENIRNIKFETIILARKFKNMKLLNKMLENTVYLIINTDRIKDIEELYKQNLKIITFGFNSKAQITASSVTDDDILICIKQDMKTINGKTIEAQEIKVKDNADAEAIMATTTLLLLYEKKSVK